MPIWKLEPRNLTDHNWKASNYKGKVIVRASNGEEARQEASGKYHEMTKYKIEDTVHSPWENPDLVTCTRLENSEYDEDGQTQILYPI
jgi:hypothetical protein